MLHGKHSACAAHAGLDFVGHQEYAILVRNPEKLPVKLRGRDDVPSFSLDRLNENGRDFLGWNGGLKERVFEIAHAFGAAPLTALAVGTPVTIGVRDMTDSRHQRTIVFPLNGFAGRQRQSAHGTAVKCPEEGDIELAPAVPPGQLESGFHRLGTRIAEVDLLILFAGGQGGQLYREIDLRGVVEIRPRHVQEQIGLILDRLDNPGVAVPGCADRNSSSEVEEYILIYIPDPQSVRAFDHEWIRPGVGGRNIFPVQPNTFGSLGPGQRFPDDRNLEEFNICQHSNLLSMNRW
jgi:hypothetical protein